MTGMGSVSGVIDVILSLSLPVDLMADMPRMRFVPLLPRGHLCAEEENWHVCGCEALRRRHRDACRLEDARRESRGAFMSGVYGEMKGGVGLSRMVADRCTKIKSC
jgi:hypothetical protein